MPNPRPTQTEEFKRKRFQRVGEAKGKLSEKPISVRLTEDVTEIIQSMPQTERVIWLRSVLSNAALKIGLPASEVVSDNGNAELQKLRRENAQLKREIKELRSQKTAPSTEDIPLFTGVKLADRLNVPESTLRQAKREKRLERWSKERDPEGWTWAYDERLGKYFPLR